ncbi:MAG TPA: hypothetical protein VIL16_30045, partial [Trebonia sp.]
NTPQFSWVLSRLPRQPQPVPPIYQPEVAAQGVVFAADHADRKEHWVGASTAGTIMAQKFAAPVLDRYLARTGFDSQQTEQRVAPGRPNNLWAPVDQPPGSDEGAHGVFDGRAHARSAQLTVTERVEEAGATVRRALGSLLGAARSRSPQHPWSAATSQQTDSGAIPASQQSTPASDAGAPPADHDANLADHDTDLADPDASLADPDTAVVDHDTSVTNIDASLPEPNVASGVDEQAPSANRHSFLDDIETPLASQDGRAGDQDAPVADENSDWTDQGVVPPTQIDVPPGQSASAPAVDDASHSQSDGPSTQDTAPTTEGAAPLRLEDLSQDRTDASQAEDEVSLGEPASAADRPSDQQS